MSEDNEARRMTLDEIAVMRQVVKWRKTNGVEFYLAALSPLQGVPQGWASWSCHKTINGRLHKREVSWDRGQAKIGEVSDYYGQSFRWHEVESVTQAVDVLVAYGYLPARFSTAYRAGWLRSGRAAQAPDQKHPEHYPAHDRWSFKW